MRKCTHQAKENNGMKMEGLNPAAFIKPGWFPVKLILQFL